MGLFDTNYNLFDTEGGLFRTEKDHLDTERAKLMKEYADTNANYRTARNPFRMAGGALKTWNLKNSPEAKQMRATETLMKEIDINSEYEVGFAIKKLAEMGNQKGAMQLQAWARDTFAKTERPTAKAADGYLYYKDGNKERVFSDIEQPAAKPEGTRYQLLETMGDGSLRQIGTKFVKKGEDIPPIPKSDRKLAWQTIGTGKKPTSISATANAGGDESTFFKYLDKKLGEDFSSERAEAEQMAQSLRGQKEAIALLDSGAITGFGANFMLSFGSALNQTGLTDNPSIPNTQAFMANQATQVAQIIKAFGAGTGLSDADREYALKAAGGDITMDEAAIRKIIDLNNKYTKIGIQKFNKKAKAIMDDERYTSPFDLMVELPEVGMATPLNTDDMSDEELLKSLGM